MFPQIDVQRMPRHIAIIMDGNRRWAKARFLPRVEGHRRGVKAVRRTLEACIDFKVSALTLYTFSSENWNRAEEEVSSLMDLLAYHLRSEMAELVQQGVRFRALGRVDQLPGKIRELVRELENLTRDNSTIAFNLALNYGGRQELVDACRGVALEAREGRLDPAAITEADFARHLTTVGLPDPDLLIRTGGEQRVSNFLLWQCAYTELVFLPVFWPDFERKHLVEAIETFARRDRRFGGGSGER
ncbi:MAG: di-trans,poly-cis-decaprenylcistransferase [Magnetococcales bacterium]|nr:di-trans,poly-cis-decaprenylcistransferase [Magnetococcales bacterium]